MNEYGQLIRELRALVKDGATPSRLIRHVLNELGSTAAPADLQEILMQAFKLPAVRISPYSAADQKGRVLNKTLLPEIVRNRDCWDTERLSSEEDRSWMDGLRVEDPARAIDNVMDHPSAGISEQSWAALRPDERKELSLQLASGKVLSDRVEVLARLAERLQQKVDELEERLKPQRVGSSAGRGRSSS